jgi:two-component system, LytTR family, response regulator
MITCLIVDDEPLAVQLLENYIQQTGNLSLVQSCHNGMDALQFLKKQKVDLVFLDINMPKLTGMELASLLPVDQKIIFTTAYSEYAVQSYEKNAIDYLLKPISFERFMKAILKVENGMIPSKTNTQEEATDTFAFFKSGKTIQKISLEKILFIEGLKDYVTIQTIDETLVVYKRMKDLEESLPHHFMRVHNSYIINKNQILKFEDNQIWIGQKQIPVSEKYREQFLNSLKNQLL